jgi:hypothetical protein
VIGVFTMLASPLLPDILAIKRGLRQHSTQFWVVVHSIYLTYAADVTAFNNIKIRP